MASEKELSEAYRQFVTTVGLITTHGSSGPNVMAAEWTYNVSYEPFLIAVHIAPDEATHEAIEETGEFGVSLVAADRVVAMGLAGHFSKREVDKLSSEVFETYPGRRIRAPMIKGATLNAECRLVQRLTLGDHTAFVGEVLDFQVDASRPPLVLHRGPRRLGPKIRRSLAVAVAVTPSVASPGGHVRVDGELTAPSRRGKRLAIILRDSRADELSRTSAVTTEGGQFSAEIPLDGRTPPGLLTLQATYRTAMGRARLRVMGAG